MISVYIAARFQDQPEARKLRDQLHELGIGCTSRWLEEEPSLDATLSDAHRERLAEMDMLDVRRAQALVLYNPEEKAKIGTGGCHTEVGMALAWGIPVILYGARSNIFHYLSRRVFSIHTPSFASFAWLTNVIATQLRDIPEVEARRG